MKKKSGFMLFETLIVSTLILGTLVFLYVQLTSIKKSYNRGFKYDTVEGLYKADQIANYLETTGYSNIKTAMGENTYIDITNCVYSTTLCNKLIKEEDVKQVLFLNQDITSFKENLNEINLNKNLKKYIKQLKNTKKRYDYRLIVEYKDGTYASVGVGIDQSELTSYTLVNMINNNGFELGISGWNITGSSNITSVNNLFKKSGFKSLSINTSNELENKVSQTVTLKANHMYFISEYLYLNKNTSGYTNIYLNSNNDYANVQFSVLRAKKWNYISSLFTATSAGNYSYNVAALNSVNNIYIDNVMLIDLTETFGAGNEPDINWCDSHITYFNSSLTLYK